MATTPEASHPHGLPLLAASELTASLTSDDLEASTRWYRDVVGFAIDREHTRDAKTVAVSLRGGAVRILLTQDDGERGPRRSKGEGLSLQITLDRASDIDVLAERIRAGGGTFETEPTDTPWGVRIFRVRDPSGFKLVFSTQAELTR